MNVLFSLTYYHPYLSGLSLVAQRIAEGLSKKNEVSLLTFNFDRKQKREEKLNGVFVIRAPYVMKVSKGFISPQFIGEAYSQVLKNDVVVINLPQFEGIILAVFGKLFKKRVISIYHCDVSLPRGLLNFIAGKLLYVSNLLSLALSDRVVTYTEDFKKNAKPLQRYSNKVVSIYPPIIKPYFNKRTQKYIEEKIDKHNHIIVGIAARLSQEKGIEYAMEAIRRLNSKSEEGNKGKRYKLVLAGPMNPVGEEKYRTRIMEMVKEMGNDIVFLGSIEPQFMGSFYSLIDVLLLPSINSTEAFGLVQVEAMMYGVPVVASDLPGVRVPVQKTGMGQIVRVKRVDEIAHAIVTVANHLFKSKFKNGEVESIFSYDKSIREYEKIISYGKH